MPLWNTVFKGFVVSRSAGQGQRRLWGRRCRRTKYLKVDSVLVAHVNISHFVDVLPPTFGASCQSSPLVVYAERGLFSAQVNWTEPVATDNSAVQPTVTSNYQPLQRFDQGTYVIVYTAVDQSGNEANCSFAIKVIGIFLTFVLCKRSLQTKHLII